MVFVMFYITRICDMHAHVHPHVNTDTQTLACFRAQSICVSMHVRNTTFVNPKSLQSMTFLNNVQVFLFPEIYPFYHCFLRSFLSIMFKTCEQCCVHFLTCRTQMPSLMISVTSIIENHSLVA